MMTINEWPLSERPREKLLHEGTNRLSDAELLAILLRTGVAGKSALDLARDLLLHFGDLATLLNANSEQCCKVHGIGRAKFTQLQAAIELTHRYLQQSIKQRDVVLYSEQLKKFLRSSLRAKEREVFMALFLDNSHHIIAHEELFQGTLAFINIYPRELLRQALKHNAAAVVIAHNHPAGNPTPSEADWALTKELKLVLELCDIRLLDHFIVGGSEVVSMRELGWI